MAAVFAFLDAHELLTVVIVMAVVCAITAALESVADQRRITMRRDDTTKRR